MNAFDQLLENITEQADKDALTGLAGKYKEIKDGYLRQSDYSRKMDEVKGKVQRADTWDKWYSENWVKIEGHPEGGMPRGEVAKAQQLEELRTELEEARKAALATGDEMTFEQLNQRLEQYSKEKNLLTKPDIDKLFADKEKEVQQFVRGNTGAMLTGALVASELNLRHFKEFGEPFDSEAFLKSAVEKNRADLRDYYDKEYVVDRRMKRTEETHKAELERMQKETEEARKALADANEKMKTQTMGDGGIVDNGGPELGPLQRRMLGEQQQEQDKMPDVPLGANGIARAAAMRDERLAAERRAS